MSYMIYRYAVNGTTSNPSKNITLPTATKTGYTFNGWYTDSALTNKLTSFNTSAFSEDVTLYAKWTKN